MKTMLFTLALLPLASYAGSENDLRLRCVLREACNAGGPGCHAIADDPIFRHPYIINEEKNEIRSDGSDGPGRALAAKITQSAISWTMGESHAVIDRGTGEYTLTDASGYVLRGRCERFQPKF